MTTVPNRAIVLGCVSLAVLALGAAQETQEVNASGLMLTVPKGWKVHPPKNQMRAANLTVPPGEGDKEPAELVVTVFPGGAGTVQQNVSRWEQQFKDATGKAPRAESKAITTKVGDATRVEVAGTYTEPTFGRGEPTPKSGYRLVGAILDAGQSAYYIKLTGPEKTVKDATPAFDRMLETATTGGK